MSDKFMMDRHKLFWHPDRVGQWLNGERIAPLHVDFGITTGCNMACRYCYGVIQARTGKKNRFDMPKEAVLNFLSDAKEIGVRSVAFIGEGENTLNEHLYDALNYAKEIDLDVSLATNGIDMKRERLEEMLRSLVWLRFNISAATPESFKRVHNVPMETLQIVIDNIKACVELKKRHELDVTLGLQMVVLSDNIDDVVPLAELGRSIGVDYLVIKPCSDTPDKRLKSPTDQYLDNEKIFKTAENLSTNDYTVSIKWSKLHNRGLKEYKTCYGTQFILGISGNGNVFPCGHFFNIRVNEFLMGNIIETSFGDIIKSEHYWNVQKKIQELNVNAECETNCRQHYINEYLFKLAKKPAHINFI